MARQEPILYLSRLRCFSWLQACLLWLGLIFARIAAGGEMTAGHTGPKSRGLLAQKFGVADRTPVGNYAAFPRRIGSTSLPERRLSRYMAQASIISRRSSR